MEYKAIFFDRDNTLTYNDPEKEKQRDDMVESWSGKAFAFSYEKMTKLFRLASEGGKSWYTNVDDERDFFKRYYYYLLLGEDVTEDLENRSLLLLNELWCNNDKLLFPETVEVLEYFKSKEYKIGVISNTSPSLELTLQQLDIAKYFTSFTSSSSAGASKPSPIIFNAALNAQGVIATESLFVDDDFIVSDGAREQGFASFLIDRTGSNPDKKNDRWTITNLRQIIEYIRE